MQQPQNRLPPPYAKWEQAAKEQIVWEMSRRDIRFKELSRLLENHGIHESPEQINRKINRKRFSAAFLLACMHAMGVEAISLNGERPHRAAPHNAQQ
jgi:3-mercaptopyruvate sulfurtransferase SseA